jgi:hypothetical protein
MLKAANLKENPYISMEMDYFHIFQPPPLHDTLSSDWLWQAIESNEVEKIYAMRVLPLHDIIAFKIKYYVDENPHSAIICRPEICLLKHIWDCNNLEFNKGIVHYLYHSKHALHQFTNKNNFPLNTDKINQWYYRTILGKNV